MFVCTECKKEFEEKPQYCDCGNNIFEEIVVKTEDSPVEDFSYKKEKQQKKTFLENYPGLEHFIKSADVLSMSIFVVCIILSIASWFLIGNDNSVPTQARKGQQHSVHKKVKPSTKIPNIDSFWDNSVSTNVQAPISNPEPKTQLFQPTPQVQTEPQTSQVSRPLPVMPKPQMNNQRQVTPVLSKSTPPVLKKKVVAKPSSSINKVSSNIAINQYKGEVRQRLVSHLAVTSILGEGRCSVAFSVDASGRLINRHFARLSDNKSLNDAVYNMMMSVPRVSPPPPQYNGQPIRLSFYFNNGYYEISY